MVICFKGDTRVDPPEKVSIEDVDGDGVPDIVKINLKWALASASGFVTAFIAYCLSK
jgi:hypothetical protein